MKYEILFLSSDSRFFWSGALNVFKKSIEPFFKIFPKALKFKNRPKLITPMILEKQFVLQIAFTSFKLCRRKIVRKRHILTVFSSYFIKALIIFRCIYYYYAETKIENVFAIYYKTNIQNSFVLVYFVCHTPQFKMLVFVFQSEIWIAQNFNFTVFEDFCLSLSWKYRFSQNVSHAKVQSKTNKYCKFHVDLTRGRLSKSRFKKLGMVPKNCIETP